MAPEAAERTMTNISCAAPPPTHAALEGEFRVAISLESFLFFSVAIKTNSACVILFIVGGGLVPFDGYMVMSYKRFIVFLCFDFECFLGNNQTCKLKFRLRELTSCLCSTAAPAVCFKGCVADLDATETGNEFSQLKF